MKDLKEYVKSLVSHADFSLSNNAKAYLNSLDEVSSLCGDEGVKIQASYLAECLTAITPMEKLAVDKLKSLEGEQHVPNQVNLSGPSVMSDLELDRIQDSFHQFSAPIVRSLSKAEGRENSRFIGCRNQYYSSQGTPMDLIIKKIDQEWEQWAGGRYDLHMPVYVTFAHEYRYPLVKVLLAQDWPYEIIGKDVRKAIRKAKEELELNEVDYPEGKVDYWAGSEKIE